MSFRLPQRLVGTSRIGPEARRGFGEFLDETNSRGTLLTEGGSWLWDVLRANGRGRTWDVCALVPHVAGYVREATDYGMFGAGWRRLKRMNPLSWFRLGIQGLWNFRGVFRKDFPTLLGLLLELEMANFRKARPPVVFLHPQITDLLLAMDHGQALEKAVRKIRHGFGAEPGLATSNAAALLPRLEAWGIEVPYLLTAVHPRGYGMRPSRQACEAAFRDFAGKIVSTLDTGLTPEVAAYWRKQGMVSAVYDAVEPDLDCWRGPWGSWQNTQRQIPELIEPVYV